MSRVPEDFPALSLHLTEVLDEISVNQKMVQMRRRPLLRRECMETAFFTDFNKHRYYFGSQIEGTTTFGLCSDIDELGYSNDVNVIQNLSEWRHLTGYLLMIQDETTAPGYCRLQVLGPLSEDTLVNNECTFDISGRVLLKNTIMHNDIEYSNVTVTNGPSVEVQGNNNRHGPAHTIFAGDGFYDMDMVNALLCKSWRPQYVRHQMLHISEENGCFLVPVGYRLSDNECIEWRISPSLQERHLMFSMNITQLRCYIILKMTVKHYINPDIPDCISSFHCKTTLFWCKEITSNDFWRDENLLTCITFCLNKLLHWIITNYCPQFLIPQENLFAGKVTPYNKRRLIRKLKTIVSSNGRFLFEIPFDDIGKRLMFKRTKDPTHVINVEPSDKVCLRIVGGIALEVCRAISVHLKVILKLISTSNDDVPALVAYINALTSRLPEQYNLRQDMSNLLQFLRTTYGSIMSSLPKYQGNGVPRQALFWIMSGLDSDVASSRLKLASVLYCSGDLYNAEIVLQDIEKRYDTDYVVAVCQCYEQHLCSKFSFPKKVLFDTNDQYTRYTAFCVRFLRSEMFCVPPALQYEMFRSTGNDVQHRDKFDDWMDWAAVDSLPFLYYLQYMTYRQMRRRDDQYRYDQYRALNNLHWNIDHVLNHGHRETAWNILGKCMELEEREEWAFYCYRQSLGLRPRDNAANWHIACLTFRVLQNNQSITWKTRNSLEYTGHA